MTEKLKIGRYASSKTVMTDKGSLTVRNANNKERLRIDQIKAAISRLDVESKDAIDNTSSKIDEYQDELFEMQMSRLSGDAVSAVRETCDLDGLNLLILEVIGS